MSDIIPGKTLKFGHVTITVLTKVENGKFKALQDQQDGRSKVITVYVS